MLRSSATLRILAAQLGRRTLVVTSRATPRRFLPSLTSGRIQSAPRFPSFPVRHYSDAAELTKEDVQERIVDLLGTYDKISDPAKITPTADFEKDLGLDSLDVVDVLYFIEEEFCIQIPDHEADEIHTVAQAIEYIIAQPDAV